MKHLFLSCIHLGSPLFKSEKAILNILDGNYEKIYLVGDIWDTWEMSFTGILHNYASITERIYFLSQQIEIIFIKGNHDPEKEEIKSIFPHITITDKVEINRLSGKIMVVHGDEFDNIIVRTEILSKILYYIFVWPILHTIGYDLREQFRYLFHSVAYRKNKEHYLKLVSSVEREAVKKHKKVIMGHTHCPKIYTSNTIVYINPGDWIHNRTFVEYDTLKDKYLLQRR
jgi:UDP-2,3-diacylglucosamine pyrophosphatase LpxH